MEGALPGVERNKVLLVPHRKEWAGLFGETKAVLAGLLGENALRIHHVGSTSIPGILAKPILDIAVVLRQLDAIDASAMERAGYEERGEQGVPGRNLFVMRSPEGLSLRHVHCYGENNENLRDVLAFRDYLRSHPEAAGEYSRLKLSLYGRYADDRTAYTENKTAFIRRILALAAGNGA